MFNLYNGDWVDARPYYDFKISQILIHGPPACAYQRRKLAIEANI